MRIEFKLILMAILGLCALRGPVRAQDQPAFKDDRAKASYALGMYFGNMIKSSGMDVDFDTITASMKDMVAGGEMKLTQPQVQETLRAYQMASQRKLAEKNLKEGEVFLAENKMKTGIKTQEVKLPDGTTAEMQYKVITEGTGAIPKSNDIVAVNYRGTFINGKEFDNSAKNPSQPVKFPVKGVVRGWTEALEMMKVGSKWELYLPASLAYGERGRPGIEPGSMLIFEMELLGIEAPPAPPAPPASPTPPVAAQPLTSDIIKVPSAEDLKKGAKIEVIKAEDAARMASEAQSQLTNSTKKQP
jgi:FKBP-type peptidyl-prolyl cis-trans isomerase